MVNISTNSMPAELNAIQIFDYTLPNSKTLPRSVVSGSRGPRRSVYFGPFVLTASAKSIDREGQGESRAITPRDFKASVQTDCFFSNGPFVRSSHMVRNKLCWDASYTVGLSKTNESRAGLVRVPLHV